MHLRGIDRFGAAGSLWGTSATGFSCSGVFRDMADFMVLMLWDADDYFGHYQTTKYLPDFDFSNMVLSFHMTTTGLQQLDSPANQWIPWRSLSYTLANGKPGTIDLNPLATYVSGTHTAASTVMTVTAPTVVYGDQCTVWFQNIAFNYQAPAGNQPLTFNYFGGNTSPLPVLTHTLVIGSNTYRYDEITGTVNPSPPPAYNLTGGAYGYQIAQGLAAAAANDPNCVVTWPGGTSNQIIITPSAGGRLFSLTVDVVGTGYVVGDTFTVAGGSGGTGTVASVNGTGGVTGCFIATQGSGYVNTTGAATSGGTGTGLTVTITVGGSGFTGSIITVSGDSNGSNPLWLIQDASNTFASQIASQINAFAWGAASLPLSATASGSAITITCAVVGYDGNSITLYSTNSSGRTSVSPATAPLTGGVSAATWAISIDFTALGIDSLKQAWLTFAPQIQQPTGGALWPTTDYQDTEWTVTVTNWNVTDPSAKRPLKIAGPGSVRVDSRDTWASYSGSSWIEEASNQAVASPPAIYPGTGWFNKGFARRMGDLANAHAGDSVTVKYSCSFSHKLYVGTSLYTDRGIVAVSIDGGAATNLDCYYNGATEPVVTRRILNGGAAIAAGTHTVTFTLQASNHVE